MKKKTRITGLITAMAVMLIGFSFPAYASYPTGVWKYKTVHGAKDASIRDMEDKLLADLALYMKEDQIVIASPFESSKTVNITLLQEGADDAPVDIGTCDKYLFGAGKEAQNLWISDTALLMPFEAEASTFEENACFEFELIQDSIDGYEEYFDNSTASSVQQDVKQDTAVETPDTEAVEKEAADPSAPLHFELEKGILDFNSFEFANPGMLNPGDDPDKTIILSFDFTNKDTSPQLYKNLFKICAYQNGIELSPPVSYFENSAPESVGNQFLTVLPDSTMTVGELFTLQDTSPVTIYVHQFAGSEVSDPMTLELGDHEDTAFDMNRLYGKWENAETGEKLTITSDLIRYEKNTSTHIRENPRLWTDETSLHQPFDEIGETLQIVAKPGEPLKLMSSKTTLLQVENWPESDTYSGEVVLAEKHYEYYDECPALPKLSSVMDVPQSSTHMLKLNDTVTEIVYTYKGGRDLAEGYAEKLRTMGFDVQDNGDSWAIYGNGFLAASILPKGAEVNIDIEPDAYQLTDLARGEELSSVTDATLGESISADKETIQKVQEKLNASGFDCGIPDGISGDKTKNAIRAYREANGLTSSDQITDELLVNMGIQQS